MRRSKRRVQRKNDGNAKKNVSTNSRTDDAKDATILAKIAAKMQQP